MSLSPDSVNAGDTGTGNAYYCGRSSSVTTGIAHDVQPQNADDIAKKLITPEIAIETHDSASNINDMISLEPNHAAPSGMVSASRSHRKASENVTDKASGSSDKILGNATPSFEFFVMSEEGIDLVVDLNSTPSKWAQNVSVVRIDSDENPCPASTGKQEIVDIPTGAQLTCSSDTHEALMENELVEEDIGCGNKLPDSCALPITDAKSDASLADRAVDGNFHHIHAAVVLYNYYHRKLSPQLAFADAKRFFMCASLSVGEDLLAYLGMVHECDNNSGEDMRLSVTDRAAMDACEIAERLDASKDSPDMTLWPISKVVVLLLNLTRKQCVIEYSSNTKGVWSIIEKEFDAAAGNSHSSNQPTGQESTNTATFGALDGPYMLQQLAFSEVESKTGMKRSNLHLIYEDLAYSLSKKGTTTKLFIMEYEQTIKSNLVEMPLEELISSMTDPIFINDPFPRTSSVVEYYHILPYKEILFELLHRKWPSDSSLNEQSRQRGKCSLHSVIDENLEDQEANSKSKLQRRTIKVSTPKQNNQVIKAIGTDNNHNCSTSKHRKNSKRKSVASRATTAVYAEDRDGESPTKENDTLVDVETSKLATKSINAKETATAAKAGVQIDKNKIQKQSTCGNIPQDDFPTKAPSVDPVMNMVLWKVKIWKCQKSQLRKQCILEDQTAQCDMDIQTILSEGEMTPKVISIIDKYKDISSNMMEVANSSCSGEGGQTMSTKRKRLREVALLRNKCQELDEICRDNNWILPRYTIVPSVADGMFYASVRLIGPDFDTSNNGGRCMTQREARCSAAANMIFELLKIKKAEEEQQDT